MLITEKGFLVVAISLQVCDSILSGLLEINKDSAKPIFWPLIAIKSRSKKICKIIIKAKVKKGIKTNKDIEGNNFFNAFIKTLLSSLLCRCLAINLKITAIITTINKTIAIIPIAQ
ncbi:Uncharacterised protein (plasmid) [Mesomycoplasma neurolyticum]|uniref:Uncharacterized protein n=1 Tax=Mesomycoplasma neurolyticum TaxID=2120 RepID=A0A449A6K0_9BACT|nr:Uncharacterised protein [Mesomycoplasma neurolyticum]